MAKKSTPDDVIRSVLSSAIATALICYAFRFQMIFWDSFSTTQKFWLFPTALINTYQDVFLIGLVAGIAIFSPAAWRQKHCKAIYRITNLIFFALILFACINAYAVRLLGSPLTFQWLYYADWFRSFTPRSAITPAINAQGPLLAFSLLAFFLMRKFFELILDFFSARQQRLFIALPALVLCGVYVLSADRLVSSFAQDRTKSDSPLLELARTAALVPTGDLQLVKDLPPVESLPPAATGRDLLPKAFAEPSSIKNVIIIVMESVGARYVAGVSNIEANQWTPRISDYKKNTIVFKNIYAHAPMSTKSLYSLITAQMPDFTWEMETTKKTNDPPKTLPQKARAAGFRTAFFMSGDLEFQYAHEFLQGHSFDVLLDRRHISCGKDRYLGSTAEWLNSDSVDDSCTAKRLTDWIDELGNQSFFSVIWTGNTHWPYFGSVEGSEAFRTGDDNKDRYLRALHSSDAAIGKILSHLEARKIFDDTLVVILGDHGQAFGEHGARIHGTDIYEEQTHIPLLLINPKLGHSVSNVLGGIVDISATISHILGFLPDTRWDGRSLFDLYRSQRVIMFAPNSRIVVGYREGAHKFIHVLGQNQTMVFDLSSDPNETINLANEGSSLKIRQNVAAWLRDQTANAASFARSIKE